MIGLYQLNEVSLFGDINRESPRLHDSCRRQTGLWNGSKGRRYLWGSKTNG